MVFWVWRSVGATVITPPPPPPPARSLGVYCIVNMFAWRGTRSCDIFRPPLHHHHHPPWLAAPLGLINLALPLSPPQ